MLIGSGMLATAFAAFDSSADVVIFASGTANSLETDPAAFEREATLLRTVRTDFPNALIVYFSSCSLADPDRRRTPYARHKLDMERLLEGAEGPYLILRLPVVIGRSNMARTLPFFIRDQISNQREFYVWSHAIRYPIDVDHVVAIVSAIIDQRENWNARIDVALRAYDVPTIVAELERLLAQPALTIEIERGSDYALDLRIARGIARRLGIAHGEDYLRRVLTKYFAPSPEPVESARAMRGTPSSPAHAISGKAAR